ncbi:MAG: aminoacyl-tRNA hydrolase [Erysipelotrichaceae bacterium]
MKMIIGLGNFGKEYANTRHNVGFMCVDQISDKLSISLNNEKFKAMYGKNNEVILVKPLTYMNNSGMAVRPLMDYFKIDIDDIIVIYDDLDLPCGKIRLRESGGAGGHNGIKSLISHLGGNNFKRIRVGIDKNPLIDTADYVLGRFDCKQKEVLEPAIIRASEGAIAFLKKDFKLVMNEYNTND